MAFAGLSIVIVYKKEKCLVKSGKDSFGASMGWVVNIHPKGLNLFVGMDRLLGKVSKQGIPLNSNTSVSMGMNITW